MDSDYRKYTIFSFAVTAGLSAYVLYLILTQVADWFKFGGSNVVMGLSWTIVGGTIAGVLGFVGFIMLATNEKALSFTDECFIELLKCTWPDMKETAQSTVVVSIMVAIAGFLLFVMDYIWVLVFKYLFRVMS